MIRQRLSKGTATRILEVRSLSEADLEQLRQRSRGSARLQSLRDSHHNVARLLASGMKLAEVGSITGHSVSALSRYQRDPSMIELIAHYRALKTEDWIEDADAVTRMGTAAMAKAVRHINDHFDDADERGELIPLSRALSVASDMMDRFGYGKKSAQLNVNVDFAAKLEAAIARTKKVAAE